jgi:hypothetical protein
MRMLAVIVGGVLAASCSPNSTGTILTRVPVAVAGVTYAWPYDGTTGDPSQWIGYAALSKRLWNETIGVLPTMRYATEAGTVAVYLHAVEKKSWQIRTDGTNLPVQGIGRFEKTEDHGHYAVGKITRSDMGAPSVIVVFEDEPDAYLTCSAPSKPFPSGVCNLSLNDRGVEHGLALSYGVWADVPAMLKLYRELIGVPPLR